MVVYVACCRLVGFELTEDREGAYDEKGKPSAQEDAKANQGLGPSCILPIPKRVCQYRLTLGSPSFL